MKKELKAVIADAKKPFDFNSVEGAAEYEKKNSRVIPLASNRDRASESTMLTNRNADTC